MTAVLAFVGLAAVATLLRAVLTADQSGFPWRTLVVNCFGAFVLGLLYWDHYDNQVALTVAGLGSLTTFSTVAAETATLLDNQRRGTAVAYVGVTLVLGIAAAHLGLTIGAPS